MPCSLLRSVGHPGKPRMLKMKASRRVATSRHKSSLVNGRSSDRYQRLLSDTGNSFLTPFSPFGMATVSRTVQPQLPEYLYALSKSEGADQTLESDWPAPVPCSYP